jgi:hypothetical protein
MRTIHISLIFLSFLTALSANGFLENLKSSLPTKFSLGEERLGYYAGASIGPASWETNIRFTPGVSLDDEDYAKRLFFGVPVNDTYAIEVSYTEASATLTAPSGALLEAGGASFITTNAGTTDFDITSFGLGLRGSWPIVESLSGTVKAGLHRWEADFDFSPMGGLSLSESGTDLYIGLGLDYYWNDFFSFRADYERLMVDEEVDMFLLGGSLNF